MNIEIFGSWKLSNIESVDSIGRYGVHLESKFRDKLGQVKRSFQLTIRNFDEFFEKNSLSKIYSFFHSILGTWTPLLSIRLGHRLDFFVPPYLLHWSPSCHHFLHFWNILIEIYHYGKGSDISPWNSFSDLFLYWDTLPRRIEVLLSICTWILISHLGVRSPMLRI